MVGWSVGRKDGAIPEKAAVGCIDGTPDDAGGKVADEGSSDG